MPAHPVNATANPLGQQQNQGGMLKLSCASNLGQYQGTKSKKPPLKLRFFVLFYVDAVTAQNLHWLSP
jgi:hypothetical protein